MYFTAHISQNWFSCNESCTLIQSPFLPASSSDSPLIVTPATRLAGNSPFDAERPAFGLESLFENFERPKFKQSIEDGHSGREEDYKGIIKPSSVR